MNSKHSTSVPNLSNNALKSKNYLIQREYEHIQTTINRQVQLEKHKDIKFKTSLEAKLKRFQNFRKFQFETEFEQQVNNLKIKLEKEKKSASPFKHIVKSNTVLFTGMSGTSDKIEEDQSFNMMKHRIKADLLDEFNLNGGLSGRESKTLQDFRHSQNSDIKLKERSKTFHELPNSSRKKVTFPQLERMSDEVDSDQEDEKNVIHLY